MDSYLLQKNALEYLPHPVSAEVEKSIIKSISRKISIPCGSEIFHTLSPCKYLYIIQKGVVKVSILLIDGREQVTGFYIEGEIFGFDGLTVGEHQCEAMALTPVEVCQIPVENVFNDGDNDDKHHFANFLISIMSREIRRDQRIIALIGALNSEERLIAFLLNLSYRKMLRRRNHQVLEIAMSRADLGNYLGLTSETVSRSLTKLQKQKFITIQGRDIMLDDIEGMKKQVGPSFS